LVPLSRQPAPSRSARGEEGLARDHPGQPLALLRGRAELRQRKRAEREHGEVGHRRDRAADLLEQETLLEEAEAAAPELLRQACADQVRVGERAPQLAVHALGARLDLLGALVRGLVTEDLARELGQPLLVVGQCEVHRALIPCSGASAARPSR